MSTAEDIGVPHTVVAPILDLVVAKPVLFSAVDISRPSNAWILSFAQYLTDTIG
jgi:hypothetical protein